MDDPAPTLKHRNSLACSRFSSGRCLARTGDLLLVGLGLAPLQTERGPQLVERGGPAATVAFLGERQRTRQGAWLAGEQLEVVIKRRAGAVFAVQPLMPGDLAVTMRNADLARADRNADAQAGQRDRHTGTEYLFWRTVTSDFASTRTVVVSVASNGAGTARSSGRSTASCSATVVGRPAIRRDRSPSDASASSRFSCSTDPTRRDRHQVVAAKPADLSLNTTLLMGALDPRGREDRVKQIMRAHRDEPIRLDPAAAAEHLLHRRAQVVVFLCPIQLCGRRDNDDGGHGG
jgi:hypothetical protein